MATERITTLVKRMGRQARGDLNIREGVDLSHILENSLILVESKLKRAQLKVHNRLSNDARRVKGDPGALEQVFMNLISNACDAIVEANIEGPEIVFSSQRLEGLVKLTIKDNGTGIPEEIQDSVFSSFVTTKPEGKGTGLGLSICKQIIEIHQGRIELGSQSHGAEFIITLPVK